MKRVLIEFIRIAASSLLIAIAVNIFFSQHSLAPGGLTGLAIIISNFLQLPTSLVTLSITGPLLICSAIFLGRGFGIKVLFAALMSPFLISQVPHLSIPYITDNIYVCAVLGACCVGTAIGNCLQVGAATGGTDTLSLLIQKVLKGVPLRVIMFCIDGTIILFSGLLTKNLMTSILSGGSLLIIITIVSFMTKNTSEGGVTNG